MLALAPARVPARLPSERPGVYAATGASAKRRRVALLAGCAQSVLTPQTNAAAIALLNRAGVDVVLAEGETCCGSLVHHMGQEARQALPAVLSLLRKEIDAPRPNESRDEQYSIIGIAAGAIGEITSDGECPPGCVEMLCEILQRAQRARGEHAPAGLNLPGPRDSQEECQLEAVWSLGILGRPAVSAVPDLLSTFESARIASNLRGLTAESLAEISRGTPEEDRVRAMLAKSWKTATPKQKTAIARALRRLGPKSEQLVADLRQWPVDSTGSQLKRVRYPR